MSYDHSPEELIKIADKAFKNFKGQFPEVEAAIGMLFIGRQLGWRALYILHSKVTIRKYEEILGIKVREFFPEEGKLVHKLIVWEFFKNVSNFWKSITAPVPGKNKAQLT